MSLSSLAFLLSKLLSTGRQQRTPTMADNHLPAEDPIPTSSNEASQSRTITVVNQERTALSSSSHHHASYPMVGFGGVCGYAPGGIPAYSNGNDDYFSYSSHYDAHLFTGYQWQCVEFARRWLLERKGLVLPLYHFAAHIIYGEKVGDLEGNLVDALVVRNGHSTQPPDVDSLIIYPSSLRNFVGHVGVITEVGPNFVRVADQNRFFHHWGDKHYSAEFPLILRNDGTYVIDDPVIQCSGWVSFPGHPNRPDGMKLVIPESLKSPPSSWPHRHLYFVWQGMRESCCGVKPPQKKSSSTSLSCCCC
ncbi:trypanothione synthetase, putative [Bodo saltans]|uniref:Trypanothione synthetase, putative n=1 Tax=Bodo saltans TaxID=75058 RepID=A0A0S4IVA9_BODSA|nr:trypanothione synthetase, putative [Bodo saltans]|eukprot:CUF51256.1 trypanothione synthetase, putative [Bodo saltans]